MAKVVHRVAEVKRDVERTFVYNQFFDDFYDLDSDEDKFKDQ